MPESVLTPAPVSTATRRPSEHARPRRGPRGRASDRGRGVGHGWSSFGWRDVSLNADPSRFVSAGRRPAGRPAPGAPCASPASPTSTTTALADYARLTDVALRRVTEPEGGLYIAESSKVIERALAAGHVPRSVLMTEQLAGRHRAARRGLRRARSSSATPPCSRPLTGYHLHRGALAAMHRPELPAVAAVLEGARRVVVLEDIVDHTNVGAIFRAVAGLGADAVLVTPRCADPLYRRSVRVSMGTVLQVPWTRLPGLARGRRRCCAPPASRSRPSPSPTTPSRSTTTRRRRRRRSRSCSARRATGSARPRCAPPTRVVTIPMLHGVDSLNVAAASAVALWALRVPA